MPWCDEHNAGESGFSCPYCEWDEWKAKALVAEAELKRLRELSDELIKEVKFLRELLVFSRSENLKMRQNHEFGTKNF